MLSSLSEHYKFDLEAPFSTLSKEHVDRILFGSGKQSLEFKYMNDRGDVVVRNHPFEGIINNMDRRYRETESNAVRDELTKYLNQQACPSCSGTRLRQEARNVFIGTTNLPDDC